jgi:hypothetical protein
MRSTLLSSKLTCLAEHGRQHSIEGSTWARTTGNYLPFKCPRFLMYRQCCAWHIKGTRRVPERCDLTTALNNCCMCCCCLAGQEGGGCAYTSESELLLQQCLAGQQHTWSQVVTWAVTTLGCSGTICQHPAAMQAHADTCRFQTSGLDAVGNSCVLYLHCWQCHCFNGLACCAAAGASASPHPQGCAS